MERMLGKAIFPSSAQRNNAGSVKIAPAATDSPAEPIVCTMLFSRIESLRRITRMIPIEITAAGMEAETVIPTRSPRYALAAKYDCQKDTNQECCHRKLRNDFVRWNIRLEFFLVVVHFFNVLSFVFYAILLSPQQIAAPFVNIKNFLLTQLYDYSILKC